MNDPRSHFASDNELADLLARFRNAKVAVLGDFFLDRYLVIDPALSEPSLETGIATRQVVAIRNSPGAAGTVVNNLAALGASHLFAVGIVGDDAYGYELCRELTRRHVDLTHLVRAGDRFTPTYIKPMLQENGSERELERIDIVNRARTPRALEDKVLLALEDLAGHVDAVIVLDQVMASDHGVVTKRVRDRLPEIARLHPHALFFADSRGHSDQFTGVVLKVNRSEALAAAGIDAQADDRAAVERAGAVLRARTGKTVLVTLGAQGILIVDENTTLVPAIPVEGPIDVVGAGDSVTAGMVLALCAGANVPQAALIGNLVASITVQQLGTTGTATPAQVLACYASFAKS